MSKKRGYLKCNGDIIIFSDDDDYYIDDYYFCKINDIYNNNPDCTITIASTLFHYEVNNSYSIKKINYNKPIDNKEFMRGFGYKYIKPGSMFTLSINAKKMKAINYEDLICFNDMSLYLYGLLADGKVYPIVEAVGVYYVQKHSMSSGVSSKYLLDNLNAKIDIGRKALEKNYFDGSFYKYWIYKQTLPTLALFCGGRIINIKEYNEVNMWTLKNLYFPYSFKAIFIGIKLRIKYLIMSTLQKSYTKNPANFHDQA